MKKSAPEHIKKEISNKNYAFDTPSSCRNPDNDPNGPWCYYEGIFAVLEIQANFEKLVGKWEYCDVPSCRPTPKNQNVPQKTCLESKEGYDYSGIINKAAGGKACQV